MVDQASLKLSNCLITNNRALGSPGGSGDAAISAEGGGLFAFDSQVNLVKRP